MENSEHWTNTEALAVLAFIAFIALIAKLIHHSYDDHPLGDD